MSRLLIFITIIFCSACNQGVEKNYLLVERLLKQPYLTMNIVKDTDIVTKKFYDFFSKMDLSINNEFIIRYFSTDIKIVRDEINKILTGDQGEMKFLYYVHDISIISKKDKSKKLCFRFIDEFNNGHWKLDYILNFDPLIDGPPDAHF